MVELEEVRRGELPPPGFLRPREVGSSMVEEEAEDDLDLDLDLPNLNFFMITLEFRFVFEGFLVLDDIEKVLSLSSFL